MIDEQWPGAELVMRGVEDLTQRRVTAEALLVAIGRPRLEGLGIAVPRFALELDQPQVRLFRLLTETRGDAAHSALNALLRRLVSFARAATSARRWRKDGPS